ncbi:uncharacterized protein si:ch211-151h10.2 isoform X2 [Gadus chalcogrammus]|uniref:uncharacterized protein si:ch211-151h10.2 isoform X2 n=1 Tax=Gadus chalcogrammus TaxID=1042646 RepID=UPI0024C4C9D1|nr:uncharacterized protein si:ch211-151h10.2 isoform X2 [Gadus chalcogrammus]
MERRWDELKKAPRDEAVSSINQLEEPPDRAFWLLTWRESCPSWRSWCAVALVCVMWSFCQVEAPLHPSLGLAEVAWRILCSGCLLAGLGACAMLLKKSLGRSGKARVSRTLQGAEGLLEAGSDCEALALVERVKALNTYLQQRTRTLGGLVRAQGEFEADVEGLLGGLELLWTQLEELHTRVTLTKDWSQGQGDLASTKAEAEFVSRMVGQYRTRLQLCQNHQRETTELLQELTWTHITMSAHVSDSCSNESVWTELLLQSNIEQFDKVQENFLSVDQQTSTFQAHLDGLERGAPDGQATGPPTCSTSSSSSSSSSAAGRIGPRHAEPAPASDTVSSLDESNQAFPSLGEDVAQTLCERSALQFSSAFGRLRKSGKKK